MNEKMKKLALFTGTLLLAGLFSTAILVQKGKAFQLQSVAKDTSAVDHVEVQSVYNLDNVAHEVGDVVIWADGSRVDGKEISTTTTANHPLVAGVIYGETCAATSDCLIQTRGYHAAITVAVATSAGDPLVTSTTGEGSTIATITMATGTAAGEAIDYPRGVFAVALEATTASTTVKGFLK